MTDELKDEVIRTALNAAIRYEVTTRFYEDKYIVRVHSNWSKDFIETIPLQEFRIVKTHIIVDDILQRLTKYVLDMVIDAKNRKIVSAYLQHKEYQKSEK